MNLAPLADVVAYLDLDPSRLAGVKRALEGRFDVVWSPVPGCLMATRALPRSAPDGERLRVAGIAFAEGRDSVEDPVSSLTSGSLPGNVGFVRVDGDKLVVVRSGPGTVPWYAWQDRERALVTTTFTEMVRLLPVEPELDPLVCALWANFHGGFPDGRSFLAGVTVIPPAHTAAVAPGRPVRSRQWWNPWPDHLGWPSRAARADHVERFRAAVLSALEREVADEPVNLLTLSGGVDSSALAYLAVRHLGRPLAALSLVPPPEAPEAGLEASYLDPLVVELGIARHRRRTLDGTQRLAIAEGTPPVAFPVLHPALQMLPELVGEWGIEVLVGGEWADEACGGWFAYPDWLDAVSLPLLITRARALPKGPKDVAAWARRRIPGRLASGPWPTSLAEWVRPEVVEEYQCWRGAQLTALRGPAGPHRYQRALLTSLDGALAMNWEVASFLGVGVRFPSLPRRCWRWWPTAIQSSCSGQDRNGSSGRPSSGSCRTAIWVRPDKSGWRGRDDDTPVDPHPYRLHSARPFKRTSGP